MDTQTNSPAPSPHRPGMARRWATGLGIALCSYAIVAYVVVPVGWKRFGEKHPSYDDNPRITETGDGHPGDAINVALTGTEMQVKGIMAAAGWLPANPLGLRSDMRIAVDTVLERSYDEAPVSRLYLYGRPEDFAYEQPVGDDPRHRHHIRYWRSQKTDQGRPIWLGSATYDERVGLSHTTGQITHHTAADIDAERDHVFKTLEQTNDLAEHYKEPGFHKQLRGKNGGGDPWYSDGALWVGVIKQGFDPSGDQQSGEQDAGEKNGDRPGDSGKANVPPPAQPVTAVLLADLRVLQSSSSQLEEVVAELEALGKSAPWRGSGFFDAVQQDQIEGLLFRYLACRHALWELANHRTDSGDHFSDANAKAKNSIIAMDAGFSIVLADARLIAAFHGDDVAIAKLNEDFYRSGIAAGTYERLFLGITNERQLATLNNSLLLYTEEIQKPDSATAKLVQADSTYRDLFTHTQSAARRSDAIVQKTIDAESRIEPDLENDLRHTRVAELMRNAEVESDELMTTARAHLFKGISRIKNPESHLIKFSPDQKRQVYELLEPGDIILTYTAGYISDIFIPGSFKHAITYVGSPAERRDSGLVADRLSWLPRSEQETLLKSVAQSELPSGQSIDVVEAVAEGVIFNHLGHIMDTHVNRLLVLRPQIDSQQRTEALANVLLFLGDEYDFKFDFADASRQVCTEVVYRALDDKGPIEFTLVRRAGHETLSADDIAHDYLRLPGESFEFVLLADEDVQAGGHQARIWLGGAGKSRLRDLMGEK